MLNRTRPLNSRIPKSGPVIYWMNRDQRVADNWALNHAQSEAARLQQPLLVVFCLQKSFISAAARHFVFMLEGLKETARDLERLNIPFLLVEADPGEVVPELARNLNAGLVVTDFSPLKLPRHWRTSIAAQLESQAIAMIEVDAHNIIPVWQASEKLEYAARTIRPKIHRQLAAWLTEFSVLEPQKNGFSDSQKATLQSYGWQGEKRVPAQIINDELEAKITQLGGIDRRFAPAGPDAANKRLQAFLQNDLSRYGGRNDPNKSVTSQLSAYLHFGQISAQRIALETQRIDVTSAEIKTAIEDFLEELIVRRELADNFCFYNPNYDSFDGFPNWAKQTLNKHRGDPRATRYSDEQLESGMTHDDLWNAAQQDLAANGRMPGYLRMYWAKKLLEWCVSPEQAMQVAVYLNDTYALDGRDPNGYTGIAWSIGGVHDRPWGERSIFGMIRFMSYDGCKRKFSIDDYIRTVTQIRLENPHG